MGTLTAGIPWVVWDPVDPTTGERVLAAHAFAWLFDVKVILLFGFLALALVIKRPFCRIACPLGLIFSFFNRVSLVQLVVSKKCDRCDACEKLCPVDIKVYEDPASSECIRCLDCTSCDHVRVGIRWPSGGKLLPSFADASAKAIAGAPLEATAEPDLGDDDADELDEGEHRGAK
jgi:polyferredoxin